jgi:hypothetical protein
MIVEARQTATERNALSIGWHAEAFARTKRLPKLAKLLAEAPGKAARRLGDSGSRVVEMLRRMKQKQEDDSGTR